MSTSKPSPLRWALLLSLTVNLALLVLLAGWLWRDPGSRGDGVPNVRALRQAVPEQARPALQASFDRHRGALRQAVRERRQARHALRPLLVAEVFDPAAAQVALTELRRREDALAAASHALLLDLYGQLDQSERRAIAERLLEQRRQRAGRRHRATPSEQPAEAPVTGD